jgi:hypothetical protein
MGSLLSKKDEEKINENINKSLKTEERRLKNEIKLLLLGIVVVFYGCCDVNCV